MATKEQLKKLRKKHHLGEFSLKRKIYKPQSPIKTMAKRRRSYSRVRKTKRYSRSSGITLQKVLVGSALVLAYKKFLAPRIPLAPMTLGLAELGVGALTLKKKGLVGDFGKVMLPVAVITMGSQLLDGTLGGSSGVSSQSSTY